MFEVGKDFILKKSLEISGINKLKECPLTQCL